MRPVGMAIVGAGSIGIRGALAHLSLPDVQDRVSLAAVCDPVEGRAEAAAAKYGVRRSYVDYEALLQDDTVDAVTLCSPIGLHYDQGLAAIRAGKHVHFNKTMTVTTDEALHLIDEARERNVRLVASPGQMIRAHNRAIRRAIQDGVIGKLSWALTGAAFGSYHENEGLRQGDDVLSQVNPSWYWRKPGGGPLYDMTVYGLHALTGILGPALKVTAMSGIALPVRHWRGEAYRCDADDNTVILLDFGNSEFAFVHGTVAGSVSGWGMPSFFGTKGYFADGKLNGNELELDLKPGEHSWGPHITGPHVEMEEHHVFEDLMQLVDWVNEGKPSIATAEHAAHVIEIIEAAYRASETGQTQTLRTTFETL